MKVLNFVVLILLSEAAVAQTMEDYIPLPQDNSGKSAITINPAIPDPDQFYFQYSQSQKARETEFDIISNDVPAKVKQDVDATDHALGVLVPIGGGASAGIVGQFLGATHRTDFVNATDVEEEEFRKQSLALRVVAKLADKLRFGLDLKYIQLENDVAGALFIADEDRSQYEGNMTGFAIGVMYLDQLTRLGVSYTPPVRGKAKLNGEEIIITESGFVDIDLGYGKEKDWFVGFNVRRWLHQRDDRSDRYETPVDQRNVSLNGLNLEQFLLPTMRYSLGADTPYWGSVYLRLAASLNEYSFLFEDDQVPGDDEDLETKVKTYSAQLVGVYNPSDFSIHAGYSYEQRKADEIDDTEGWFSGQYLNYKSVDTYFYAMFVYQP